MVTKQQSAERIVRDMERIDPYRYEGLYATFLGRFMESDKSRWTHHLSRFFTDSNRDWAHLSTEIAAVLWDRFEKRISC